MENEYGLKKYYDILKKNNLILDFIDDNNVFLFIDVIGEIKEERNLDYIIKLCEFVLNKDFKDKIFWGLYNSVFKVLKNIC